MKPRPSIKTVCWGRGEGGRKGVSVPSGEIKKIKEQLDSDLQPAPASPSTPPHQSQTPQGPGSSLKPVNVLYLAPVDPPSDVSDPFLVYRTRPGKCEYEAAGLLPPGNLESSLTYAACVGVAQPGELGGRVPIYVRRASSWRGGGAARRIIFSF
jgi:hypothetical protein